MAIYTRYGSEVTVIGPIGRDGTIWIKRIDDGVEFNVPTLELKATHGIQEIEKAASAYNQKEVR